MFNPDHPHGGIPFHTAGVPLEGADTALILLHGRGASADDILTLHDLLDAPNLSVLAPQAAGAAWYPQRFIAPIEENEPHLSSALARIGEVVAHIEAAGIPAERIVLGGFSQGACLASEFVIRNPRRWGGLITFSGGYIGPLGEARQPQGHLHGTPAFLGCSDVDPHIPLQRVRETTAILTAMGAQVTERIYRNMGHTIYGDEIDHANHLLRGAASGAKVV